MDRSLTWLSYVALWVARLNIVEVEAITIPPEAGDGSTADEVVP